MSNSEKNFKIVQEGQSDAPWGFLYGNAHFLSRHAHYFIGTHPAIYL
jgi:hypothetical protein